MLKKIIATIIIAILLGIAFVTTKQDYQQNLQVLKASVYMDRVRKNTKQKLNTKIDQQLKFNIQQFSHSDCGSITNRIKELDKEWDVERALEVNMPVIALSGLALGAFVNKRWLALPVVILGFFLQHAIQGWCPPLPLFRRLGVRTKAEIERERYALKAIRGDFDGLSTAVKTNSEEVLLAVNKK